MSTQGARATAARRLTRQSLALVSVAIGLVVVSEVVAFTLRTSGILPDVLPDVSLLGPASKDGVLAFVGAGVAAAATLLGLYYATVGVVASTVYKDVPGEVRDLFVRERDGETYIYALVLAVAGGLTVLALSAFGYPVAGLTILVLAGVAILTTVWLAVLGQRLFGFFDPTMLSRSLPKQIAGAVHDAAGRKTRGNESRQRRAHVDAVNGLAMFRQIAEIVERANYGDARAPLTISYQLLRLVARYSQSKDAIPTESSWWAKTPNHQNWLTIDFFQLNTALSTASGVAPKPVPDAFWFERNVAGILRVALPASMRARGGTDLLALAETASNVSSLLVRRLQVREALMMEEAWGDAIRRIADEPLVDGPEDLRNTQRLAQQSAAESLVIPLTRMWLGFREAADDLLRRDLDAQFDAAITGEGADQAEQLPTKTRRIAETFAAAITLERRTEGRRVTPAWWANHYLARTLSDEFLTTHKSIVGAIDARTTEQVAAFRTARRPDLAAVTAIAALELFHKVEVHTPAITEAQAKLASHRNPNTENELWPDTSSVESRAEEKRTATTVSLGELLPELRSDRFESDAPDLYGQAYQFVRQGAFDAILNGDRTTAARLYAAIFDEVGHLQDRIQADLSDRTTQHSLGLIVEPIVGAMELAGLALFMQELDDEGIWAQVLAQWDLLIAAAPGTPGMLMAAIAVTDDIFLGGPGGMNRTARGSAFAELLSDRGLDDAHESRTRGSYPFGRPRHRPHRSPIVSAMMPSFYGHTDDFHHLFVAAYLADRLPPGTQYDAPIQSLMQQLSRFRSLPFADGDAEDGAAHDE